jgi:hypothetical protein
VSTIEELFGRNNSGSGLERREYCCGDLLCWPHDTLYPQKLVLTSPTSSCRSVSIVCSRTEASECRFLVRVHKTFKMKCGCRKALFTNAPQSICVIGHWVCW